MTDLYNPQQYQQPPQAEEPPQEPEPQGGGSPYDGLIAENAQGHRIVWRSNSSGRGRWVEVSPSTADTAAREQLEQETSMLSRLRDTSRLAEDFIEHNRYSGTGGLGQAHNNILGLELSVPAFRAPHRQAMQGLSAEMVRSNIRPGMAQTMNSDAEQMMAQRTYPSEEAGGDVNAERALRVLVNRDVQYELVNQMQQWLTRHPNLSGFQQQWQRSEPEIRRAITAQHVRSFGSRGYNLTNLNDRGLYEPGAGAHRPPLPQDGVIRMERDPNTGEIRRVR